MSDSNLQVAVVKLGALGDIVRTLSLARQVADGGKEVWWFCGPDAVPLLERSPHVSRVVSLNDVSEEDLPPFEVVWSLDEDLQAVELASRLASKKTIGLELLREGIRPDETVSDWFGMGLVSGLDLESADEAKRANRKSLGEHMAIWMGVVPPLPSPRIVPRADEHRRAAALLAPALASGSPLVAIAPGAGARWPTKAMPAATALACVREAARLLEEQCDGRGRVCLVGGEEDHTLLEQVAEAADGAALVVPSTSELSVYAAVLAACELVVCADSLPLHLARAVGTPVVALFGPTSLHEIDDGSDIVRLSPRQARSWPCMPCFKSECVNEEFCMDAFETEELKQALTSLWPPAPRTIVTVPTHEEEQNVDELIDRLLALELPGIRILFADDAGADQTAAAIAMRVAADARVILLERSLPRGRGRAGREAFVAALEGGAGRIVEMDADLSHRPEDLPLLLAALDGGADIAVGSRRLSGGADNRKSFLRGMLSRGAAFITRAVTGSKLSDPTSGYRAYSRSALEAISPTTLSSSGPEIVEEVLARAHSAGLRIVEVPITFAPRHAGASKLGPLQLARVLLRVLALRFRRIPRT